MKKAIKIAGITILVLGIYLFVHFIVSPVTEECNYEFIDSKENPYNYLFQDSISKQLNRFYSIGNSNGGIYAFTYNNKYRFVVWGLRELNSINLNNAVIAESPEIKWANIAITKGCNLGPDPEIDIESKVCIDKLKDISINIESNIQLPEMIKSEKYKYLYGELNKFSITNEVNDEQIIVSFDKKRITMINTGIVLYKNRSSFFLIIINPLDDSKVDEKTLKLLKLS